MNLDPKSDASITVHVYDFQVPLCDALFKKLKKISPTPRIKIWNCIKWIPKKYLGKTWI